MATTSAERMRRLREQRAERLFGAVEADLGTLPDGELLDRLALAFRHNLPFDVRQTADEIYRRAKARRDQADEPYRRAQAQRDNADGIVSQ